MPSQEKNVCPFAGAAQIVVSTNSPPFSSANQLQALERENRRLRQLVAELTQERNLFSQIAIRNW